jgi:hypothetical protein
LRANSETRRGILAFFSFFPTSYLNKATYDIGRRNALEIMKIPTQVVQSAVEQLKN